MSTRLGSFTTDKYAIEDASKALDAISAESRLSSTLSQDKATLLQERKEQKQVDLGLFNSSRSATPKEGYVDVNRSPLEGTIIPGVSTGYYPKELVDQYQQPQQVQEVPTTGMSVEEFKQQRAKERYENEGVLDKAQKFVTAIPAMAVKGAVELADVVQEVATLPAQAYMRSKTGDSTYDIDFLTDETKQAFQDKVDSAVGYDRATTDYATGEAVKRLKEAGAEFSWDGIGKLFTDPKQRDALINAVKTGAVNPDIVSGSLAELFAGGGVAGAAVKGAGKVAGAVASKIDDVTGAVSKETKIANAGEEVVTKDGIPTIPVTAPSATDIVNNIGDALKLNSTKLREELAAIDRRGLGKAEKAAAIAELEKTYTLGKAAADMIKGDIMTNAYAANLLNNHIQQFKDNNNGEDPSWDKLAEMAALVKITSGTEVGAVKYALGIKTLTDAEKKEIAKASIAGTVASMVGRLSAAGVMEGGQEILEGVAEQLNTKLDSANYGGKSAQEILQEASAEIIAGGAMGAVGGVQMKGVGIAAEAVASGTTTSDSKVVEDKAVKTTTEAVQDVNKAIDDEITQFTSGASNSQPAVRAEVAGMAREDVIAAENAVNNASEEIRQAMQLKVLAAMKARAEASQDSTIEVNAAKEILTTATYRSEDRAAVVDALATLYSNDTKEAATQEAVVRSKLQESSYSVEEIEEVVTEAKALGEALSAFKKVEGVTGKSAKTVSSEVLQEGRGGIAYYSGAMVGMVTGNEQMVEQYANSLSNLTALQSNKIATMDAGIATAKEELVNDIANKLGVSTTNDRYIERIREYVYGKRPINDNTPAIKRALTELKTEYEKAQARVSIWKGTVPVNGKLPEFQLSMGSLAESVRDSKPVGGLVIVEGVRREVKALETLQATLQKARVRKVSQPEEKATESVTESSASTGEVVDQSETASENVPVEQQSVGEDLSSLDAMADQYVSTEVDTAFDINVTIDESTIPTWDDVVAEDTTVEKEVYLDANEKVKLYQEYVDKIKAQKAEIAASKEAAYKAMKSMPEEVKSAVAAVVEDPESLVATIAEDVVKSGIISHIDTRIAEQEKLVSNAKKRLSEIAPNRKAVKPELREEARAILRDNAKSEKAVVALKQLQDNIRNCK